MASAWLAGGVYALLGAICTAELAAALPRTGGWTVYAERAFGRSGGLLVGWADWLAPCDRPDCWRQRRSSWGGIALAELLLFTLIQVRGLRAGSASQEWLSLAKAIALLALLGLGRSGLLPPPAAGSV